MLSISRFGLPGSRSPTRGETTIKEIENSTSSNRNTIKVQMKQLAERRYLVQLVRGCGARYVIK